MPKILIIDDEHVLRSGLRDVLVFEDFNVIEAANGATGLELARQERPDLIICDIAMPDMDGFDVLTQLRMSPETESIPIIMLTARAESVARKRVHSLGADGYITKPFSIDEILEAIQTCLSAE